ncbi:MAG: HAMP domain-containing sensor histidine kinase [Patescibacteria group bacterium]|mgnify:CR=1 FL=1
MVDLFCPWDAPTFLIFSENVPRLFYYSHGVAAASAILLGFFVYFKDPKVLVSRILLGITTLFSTWVFLDIAIWATNAPSFVMFWWSAIILVEVLVFALAIYFLQVFVEGRDVSLQKKHLMFLLLCPVIALLPTKFNLSGIEIQSCLAIESSFIIYYTYFFETLVALLIVHFSFLKYRVTPDARKRREIIFITIGIILFLLAFSYGNIVGSITTDWELAQYGLFGMPIFIGFLAYLIVRFHIFNIRLLGAQALVFTLVALIGSQFFFIQNPTNKILNSVTFALAFVFGYFLVRGVKREVAQREHIEKLAKELEVANVRLRELDQMKSEFVSLASHQIRGPLTAIKGYASMMTQGDYGVVPDNLKEIIQTISDSSNALMVVVQDFLDVSRIEQGKMKYDFSVFDLSKLTYDVANELSPNIERKGLRSKLEIEPNINVYSDIGKIRQVIQNLIDNALKYTQKGYITVSLKKAGNSALLTIRDTGVGIKPEVLPKLFQKFSRAEDASKANILGTGLGLYVAKQLIEAQNGKVWAESEGEGKGSTFMVELPYAMDGYKDLT